MLLFIQNRRVTPLYSTAFYQGSDFEEDGGGEAAVDMGFKIEPYTIHVFLCVPIQ